MIDTLFPKFCGTDNKVHGHLGMGAYFGNLRLTKTILYQLTSFFSTREDAYSIKPQTFSNGLKLTELWRSVKGLCNDPTPHIFTFDPAISRPISKWYLEYLFGAKPETPTAQGEWVWPFRLTQMQTECKISRGRLWLPLARPWGSMLTQTFCSNPKRRHRILFFSRIISVSIQFNSKRPKNDKSSSVSSVLIDHKQFFLRSTTKSFKPTLLYCLSGSPKMWFNGTTIIDSLTVRDRPACQQIVSF